MNPLMRLWQKLAIGAAAIVAAFASSKPREESDDVPPDPKTPPPPPPDDERAPRPWKGTPFAVGAEPTWPTRTTHARGLEVPYIGVDGSKHGNLSRRFGADRGDHWHQGIDLYTKVGDPVVAMESGTVTGLWNTFHLGTGAVVLVTDSGLTIVYGEIGPGTWKHYGITKGQRVVKGQPLATVQPNTAGTWMLHLETYAGAFSTNDPPKASLLDPTIYLLDARRGLGVA